MHIVTFLNWVYISGQGIKSNQIKSNGVYLSYRLQVKASVHVLNGPGRAGPLVLPVQPRLAGAP